MTIYYPDLWVLVRIEAKNKVHYRVLASWYGGFANGDSWKLSSGMEEDQQVTLDDLGCFLCPQSSGSIYVVNRGNFGMSGYTSGVAKNFIKQAEESNGEMRFEILEESQAIGILEGLVKQ